MATAMVDVQRRLVVAMIPGIKTAPNGCTYTASCTEPAGALWIEPVSGRAYCQRHRRGFDGSMPRERAQDGQAQASRDAAVRLSEVRGEVHPVLLFPRRMLEHAVETAKKYPVVITVEQRQESAEARRWIEYRANWQDKADWFGSFDWCCHWLGACDVTYGLRCVWPRDCDTVRQRKLMEIDAAWAAAGAVRELTSQLELPLWAQA